jgi:hypothetical protein
MSLDASDLVDQLLDDQARVNSAVDDGDIANLVADFQSIFGETVGFTGEAVTTTLTAPPHNWDDTPGTNTVYGFFSWA